MSVHPFLSQQKYLRLGGLINLSFIVVTVLANEGLSFWDDFTYLQFAHAINTGTFEITTNHFTSRIALLYPTAWLIQLFGISAYTMTFFPLLCALLLLNALLWYGHKHHHGLGIVAALLFFADYHSLTFATKLFPEMPLALYLLVALMIYQQRLHREGDVRLQALLMALVLFLAYLTKMSVVLWLPLFGFLFISDFFLQQRNKRFWRLTLALLLFFFITNAFWYQEVHGDFFFRFSNIAANHEASDKTFFDKDKATLLKRLTYLPLTAFAKGGFFIPLLLAIPAFFQLKRSDWRLENPEKLWPVSVLWLLGTWWFMSTSWEFYSPMPVETRHIYFVIPLLVMSAAHFWIRQSVFETWSKGWRKAVLLVAVCVIPTYKIVQARQSYFAQLEDTISSYFVKDKAAQRVFSDGLLQYGAAYFYRFQATEDQYIWFTEPEGAQPRSGDYLMYVPHHLNPRFDDPEGLEGFKNHLIENNLKLDTLATQGLKLFKIQSAD